ncbi:MAG: Hsp20/alpha crystallin family protein [Nitrospirae bacterium]|nr:Hsp20/alpha crystallin family protein [Nitrospirota bacterium]
MAEKKKKVKKEEKAVEPYRPSEWLTPFRRMEEMFEDFFRRPLGRPWWPSLPQLFKGMEPTPSVDIFEEGDDVVVKTELPGMEKDDVDVNLTENAITISGEKKKEEKVEKKDYYHFERSYGSFSRTFTLPAEVQTDKAKASFKKGVLEVRIPKTEEAKKKTQKVKIE